MRPTTEEAGLNGTEAKWRDILMSRGFVVKTHALTFRLAPQTTYTPEFLVVDAGRLVIYEVKGSYVREDAWVKLKWAAREFPMFIFKMVQLRDDGKWEEKEIPP